MLLSAGAAVVGGELDSLTVVLERRILSKMMTILDYPLHPVHDELISYRSLFSNRLIHTLHHKVTRDIIPVAIKLQL